MRASKKIFSDADLLGDLSRVAGELNTTSLSQADYSRRSLYSFITICRRFGSWKAALARVNLQPAHWMNVTGDMVIADIRNVADKLQTRHLRLEQYLTHGMYSATVITRLFQRWYSAAEAAGQITFYHRNWKPGRGPRTINLSLRFQIMRRDQFRCRVCGGSPATDGSVRLEVDHIIPWASGGTTAPGNLQTLCQRCNRGKSDTSQVSSFATTQATSNADAAIE